MKIGIAGIVLSIAGIIALLFNYNSATKNGRRLRVFGLVVASIVFLFSVVLVLVMYRSVPGRDPLLG